MDWTQDLFAGAGPMAQVVVMAMLLVLSAMIIDLLSGLYKAKQRGELRTSEALRRSLTKFVSYEGGMLIAAMVDLMIHFAKFYALVHLNLLTSVPVVTLIVGIFLLIVEFLSVREKADEKTKKHQSDALALIAGMLTKEDMKWLAEKILEKKRHETENQ